MLSWFVYYKYFEVLTKEEVEIMRNAYDKAHMVDRPIDFKEQKETEREMVATQGLRQKGNSA